MKGKFLTVLSVMMLIAIALPVTSVSAGKSTPPTLTTLQPGGFHTIEQDLSINVVFVGYEQGSGDMEIADSAFLGELPSMYRAINRAPSFYLGNQFIGLTFNYDYNLVYASDAFEEAFFGYLSGIATPQPLTFFQGLYNDQAANSLDVVDNYWIDAPSVEQWLADNTESMLDVDTQQYTIFFVNWYGRSDFKFHVYTKTDEPDPDTGFNFGANLDDRKFIAWGGTAPDDEESGLGSLHRIWFYDLSAGPEAWTANWNVDDADLDGNGITDYRMPPVWEYGNAGGYRAFDNLSTDLGKVARYVAINLLFTASPLYKPAISGPDLPSDVELDINVFQIDPNSDGTDYFDTDLLVDELSELQPLNNFSVEMNSQPVEPSFERMYLCFYNDVSCFGNRMFGIAFADPFLYFSDHLIQYLEGDADYEIPIIAYNTTDELFTCCLGYADDNWVDGTQSYVYGFDAPFIRDFGYGFTTTFIHEVGHHIGMSHPHDGYDYEADVEYGPGDDFFFAWSGDESNTMMSYIDLNWDFSQFDRDNMNRYLTSVYINQANSILARIYASSRAGQAASTLTSADASASAALVAYDDMNYAGAASHAKDAYSKVLAAASQIGIQVEPQSWQADYKAKGAGYMFVDNLEGHRIKP